MMRYGKVKKMPSERLSDGIGAIRERRNIEAPAFQIGRRAKPPALAHRSGLLASAPDPVFRFAMRETRLKKPNIIAVFGKNSTVLMRSHAGNGI